MSPTVPSLDRFPAPDEHALTSVNSRSCPARKDQGSAQGVKCLECPCLTTRADYEVLLLFTNTLDHLCGIGKYYIPFTCAETHRNIKRQSLRVASACMCWVLNSLSLHTVLFQVIYV